MAAVSLYQVWPYKYIAAHRRSTSETGHKHLIERFVETLFHTLAFPYMKSLPEEANHIVFLKKPRILVDYIRQHLPKAPVKALCFPDIRQFIAEFSSSLRLIQGHCVLHKGLAYSALLKFPVSC